MAMRHLISAMLLIVGVIHLLPLTGVAGASQLRALIAGFVSVLSFLYLAWSVGGYNEAIARVVAADVVALGCLVVASVAYLRHYGIDGPK
jgi:hypothetical protein